MLIVTPNPAVDHTVRLSRLSPGEVIRTGAGLSVAGGKGGNVARASRLLGTAATVLAFVPAAGGDHLRSLYAAEALALTAVPVQGTVRTCTALREDDGRMTLLNEPGAAVTADDWARLMAGVTQHMSDHPPADADGAAPGLVVCSGSLPPGAPEDGYAQIVRVAVAAGYETIVDAATGPLMHAITAGAHFVCPNLSEAEHAIALADAGLGPAVSHRESVSDPDHHAPERARTAARRLRERGAQWVVVTAGAEGVAVSGPEAEWWLRAPEVAVSNPIGAGDSFVAGVATARVAGRDWPEAVRRGLAAGSASVEQDAAGVVDPLRVAALERLIARP